MVFLILNNGAYRILRLNMDRYRAEIGLGPERGYPHLDLADPPVDFVAVAKGFGCEACRIESPAEIAPAVAEAFASGRPWLLDVVVEG